MWISELCELVVAGVLCLCLSENEILREGNISLEILRDKLKTRVSDLEEEMRRLRNELEQSVSNKETKTADDEVIKTFSNLELFYWYLYLVTFCFCVSWWRS